MRWIALAAVIWASCAAVLGYIFGQRFADNHTLAFVFAFVTALSITVGIEVVRHIRSSAPPAKRVPPEATMLAVVVVRGGMLPLGADEVVAEAGGRVLVAVDDAAPADLAALDGVATEIEIVDLGAFEPPRWAAHLADLTAVDDIVVLPASADGRDLAARLAHCRNCDLFAKRAPYRRRHGRSRRRRRLCTRPSRDHRSRRAHDVAWRANRGALHRRSRHATPRRRSR
ncbi:MAG: hypothetical protein WKF58_08930 [Ilumatobacteraceae bacterium]